MGLFRQKPELDAELDSRLDRLESECRQAKRLCESLADGADKQNRLKDLAVAEQAVAEARAEGDKAARIRAALTWIIREDGDSGGDTGASVWYKRCVHKRLATTETPA